jgi:Ser-tRNA(Ala) deacylase AlaX
MKTLPTVNQKSVYAAAGLTYAEIENSEEITNPVIKATLKLKALQIQTSIYVAELKRRQMDQIDLLNDIKTDQRIIEIKNFDQIPIEEKASKEIN